MTDASALAPTRAAPCDVKGRRKRRRKRREAETFGPGGIVSSLRKAGRTEDRGGLREGSEGETRGNTRGERLEDQPIVVIKCSSGFSET